MNVLNRIIELRDERNWSNYKLAKEANIPQSTLTNLIKHNNLPTIPTLISMCNAFGITLTQFFTDKDDSFLTPEQNELLNNWALLSTSQKELLKTIISGLLQKKF